MTDELEVVDEGSRYALREGDRTVGFAEYARDGDRVVFTHTEIDAAAEGRGYGSRLVRGALDDVRRQGLRIVPLCPFVRAFVQRHPEYAELVL